MASNLISNQTSCFKNTVPEDTANPVILLLLVDGNLSPKQYWNFAM